MRWRAPARPTNLQLFVALAVAFATGAGAMATGSERGRWIVIAHGVAGMVVVALIPWKTRVVRAGIRHHPVARYFSLTLAALTLTTLFFGLAYATGLVRSVAGLEGMWWHVASALALVPLLLWHIGVRLSRPRRTDVSRRWLLAAAAGGLLYGATTVAVRLLGAPGAARRFTGSYEVGTDDPARMPETIWLDDTPPVVDPARWRLRVSDALGAYQLSLSEMPEGTTTRATLDCTSGWYAHQDWTGVPVSRLLRGVGDARSLRVTSVTGYWVRLPLRDPDSVLLVTGVGGAPLAPGHGFPLRLVAPGRRGFWWVKWVEEIALDSAPWWWQPPFPVT
jgi:hypothetical protein